MKHLLWFFNPRPKFCITRQDMMNVAINRIIASTAADKLGETDFAESYPGHSQNVVRVPQTAWKTGSVSLNRSTLTS